MSTREIKLSKEFKSESKKAVFAIAAFILCYLLILVLAIGFIGLCIAGGVALVNLIPHVATLFVGIGIVSIGVIVLYFLIRFIFKWHKMDLSHLIEITEPEQPELFAMIYSVAAQVNTDVPKRVYLAADLNASVFYDSSFLSLFLPVRKNLVIGLALVNSVTKEELRSIIAHEFGHFSQGSMRVGSYIYYVNQVLFNALNGDEDFRDMAERWGNLPWFIAFSVPLAYKVNQGVQWILRKCYVIVNKAYMGLSREMEFHADEIAASVTGIEPMKTSLLRMGLAETSFESVFNFYSANKIADNVRSANVYHDHLAVIGWMAEVNHFALVNDLPDMSIADQSKYDKTKLVIKDQWASHPSISDRIARLDQTGYHATVGKDELANSMIRDLAALQETFTQRLFEGAVYEGNVELLSSDAFIEEYKGQALSGAFPAIYNGYYDIKNPTSFDVANLPDAKEVSSLKELFSDEKVDWVYQVLGMNSDMKMLQNIAMQRIPVKTFDYDGIRYTTNDVGGLIEKLKLTLQDFEEKLKANDVLIYQFFLKEEVKQNRPPKLTDMYTAFFACAASIEKGEKSYQDLTRGLNFVNETKPFQQIKKNLARLQPLEEIVKKDIRGLLEDEGLQNEISLEVRTALEKYISQTWMYFNDGIYLEDNLRVLQEATNGYMHVLSTKYLVEKKKLLMFQDELIQNFDSEL